MVESRPANYVKFVIVANTVHVAARIEQSAHDLEVSLRGSPVQRVSVVPSIARVRIRASLEQQPYRCHMSALRCGVQSCPALVARLRVTYANRARIVRQQVAQHIDIPTGASLEEERDVPCLPLIDFRLQRTPTGEAVVARYRQQSRCKLCLWVCLPQFLQSILCQFFQILERSAFREFRVLHRHLPSSYCPPSAPLG